MTSEQNPRREDAPLLRVNGLSVEYRRGRERNLAVNDVSFSIRPGETIGLVGESGSGKSTVGKAILGLVPVLAGSVQFQGRDITDLPKRARRALTRDVQVIYQDPYSSLDPTKPIGYTVAEPVQVHDPGPRGEVRERVVSMLRRVGLDEDAATRYPAQFSGGQRQRIAIARALILSPKLVVCDEPVSALDLSIQAEVINLMAGLRRETGASFLFISHDLTIVRHISDRVVVLKDGRIVEYGDAEEIYADPRHNYTRRLLAAAPVPDPDEQARRNRERLRANLDDLTDAIATSVR